MKDGYLLFKEGILFLKEGIHRKSKICNFKTLSCKRRKYRRNLPFLINFVQINCIIVKRSALELILTPL